MATDWLGSLIEGGFDYLGARAQAGATKEAAKIQADTARRALAQQQGQYDTTRADLERTYQQQRADEAPYLQMGGGAATALTGAMGWYPEVKAATTTPTPKLPGAPIPGAEPPYRPGAPNSRLNAERAATEGGERPGGPMRRQFGGPGATAMPLADAGSGVPMRAPNGQIKQVAPSEVAHYTQLGAQVV